jgi:hypothetical protein
MSLFREIHDDEGRPTKGVETNKGRKRSACAKSTTDESDRRERPVENISHRENPDDENEGAVDLGGRTFKVGL